ncbi:MAG: diaminopimelate epimerase [Candidatus Pacebacteria bacterium]|nr:diaminopimelate epimerase [Candidatus Paceibacterota bacterium]
MHFYKYHALGNDYIVVDPADAPLTPNDAVLKRLCHRHFGVGGDGVLWGPIPADDPHLIEGGARGSGDAPDQPPLVCGLRIFNPDGSEAEKSGNGLRIFCRYLRDTGRVTGEPFRLATLGGNVECRVADDARSVQVAMGRVSFLSKDIPVAGPPREVINETIQAGGETLVYCSATIGNPHCVIVRNEVSEEETRRLGPSLETHTNFPNRTNVQFMQIVDPHTIRIEIWERGAGYTLASGSSASACAAIARRLQQCESDITVSMPGGELNITVNDAYDVTMEGPVTAVAQGTIAEDLLAELRS